MAPFSPAAVVCLSAHKQVRVPSMAAASRPYGTLGQQSRPIRSVCIYLGWVCGAFISLVCIRNGCSFCLLRFHALSLIYAWLYNFCINGHWSDDGSFSCTRRLVLIGVWQERPFPKPMMQIAYSLLFSQNL